MKEKETRIVHAGIIKEHPKARGKKPDDRRPLPQDDQAQELIYGNQKEIVNDR